MNPSLPLFHNKLHRKHDISIPLVLQLESSKNKLYPSNDIFHNNLFEINPTSQIVPDSSEIKKFDNLDENNVIGDENEHEIQASNEGE